MKEKILVSACLLGTPCRYDGLSRPNLCVISLKDRYELIPVCPEELGGLKTPRIPAEIVKDRVITENGQDVTKNYQNGALKALEIAKAHNISLAILKSKSPSCGKGQVYDGTFTKTLTEANGITVSCLIKNGIKVLSESELHKI